MPITTLDPVTALVVVDLQAGFSQAPLVHSFDAVVGNAARLAEAFRSRRLPVVLVTVEGTPPGRTDLSERNAGEQQTPAGWADLVPELDAHPNDKIIRKHSWGAFHDTDLLDHLNELGVTEVVVCGVATAVGVEATARQAHERGLNVAIALDAITDFNPVAHDNSVTQIFPMLGQTGTVEQILTHIDRRSPSKASS